MSEDEKKSMLNFILVWVGQVVSMLGSTLTGFALMFWAYAITGQVTALALVAFFSFLPQILLSPVAGALVDRWDRKLVMILSDLGAGVSTIAIFLLFLTGNLEIWHLYFTGAFAGAFGAFQFPAYSAATTMMVPKKHYARASGMISMAGSAIGIIAPILAASLIASMPSLFASMTFIMSIDILSFCFAIGVLLFIPIPTPPESKEGKEAKGSLIEESLFGFKYIFARKGLLGLLIIFMISNMISNLGMIGLVPMLLSRMNNDPQVLGWVLSIFGVGGLLGGFALTVWGGPKRKIKGVLYSLFISSLIGMGLLSIGVGNITLMITLWMIGAFIAAFVTPTLAGSSQAIWQSKVPPDIQGKVFSARLMIALVATPFGMLMGGPLADHVFEPAMTGGGLLPEIFGPIVGTSAGSGIALMILLAGLIGAIIPVVGYSIKAIRNLEDNIPDHDEVVQEAKDKENDDDKQEDTNEDSTPTPA